MEKMQFSTTTRCETERIREITRDGGVERMGAGRWTTDAGTRWAKISIVEALRSVRSVRRRTYSSMALARASPRCRDGPAEHLRWKTGIVADVIAVRRLVDVHFSGKFGGQGDETERCIAIGIWQRIEADMPCVMAILSSDDLVDATALVAVASSKEQGLLHHRGSVHVRQLCLPR